MQEKTLADLAKHVGGTVVGDPNTKITSAATMEEAGPEQITFLANIKYRSKLTDTKAAAVIVGREFPDLTAAQLIADDPYYAFMQILVLMYGHRKHPFNGISPAATIAKSAKLGTNCNIAHNVTIEPNATIGDGCTLYPGVYIGKDASLGSNCVIYPSATIYDRSILGDRVIVNANSSVGQDGFGYATHQGVHHKIPHVGLAILEDDVEIGCSCSVERGTLGDTVIGQGTKLGDNVTIGHGSKIGAHCLLVAQVGVAGSANIGNYCVVGGQVGIVGHINIGNQVMIGAQAGVINDVPDGKMIVGSPAIDAGKARRAYSMIEYLPELRRQIKTLQKQLAKIEEQA